MLPGIPKISVKIITYNQEVLIRRAIDSILPQLDYVYEICISDDCSQDGTWAVLEEYSRKYPGLFKLSRNEVNVGIFENIERSRALPTGDIVYTLAGDDECGKDWFKAVVEFINDHHIDYKNELFCIYGDYECRYPNGDTFVFSNKLVDSGQNLLKLALRGLIGNRGACSAVAVSNRFVKVSQGRSHIAEDALDRQLQIISKTNYYIPQVANVYYSYVGVSKHLTEDVMAERKKIRPYALSLFEKWGVELDKKDMVYSLEYFPAYERMINSPSLGNILKVMWLYLKSYDCKLRTRGQQRRSIVFAIRRRLPHRRPIHFR